MKNAWEEIPANKTLRVQKYNILAISISQGKKTLTVLY
jgi:hypothetical protein